MTSGRPELCVGAIAVRDECLLMVRRGRQPGIGLWSVPGGHVEAGESVVSAVVRELAEETGVDGVCGPLMGWIARTDIDHHHVILDFEVTVLSDGRPAAGDDAAEAAWVPLGEIGGLDLVDGLAAFLVEHGVTSPLTLL